MKIGFLGTGAITSAMVTGLKSAGSDAYEVLLSPRNAEVAADLSSRFPKVSVASSNQQILDESQALVIAVRPQIAADVLARLHFNADHHVISLVSGYSMRKLTGLVAPAAKIVRAVPLPSAARRMSPTAIYPKDEVAEDLFNAIGTAFDMESETQFDAICTATATMATYFAFAGGVSSWLSRNGIPEPQARDYVARIFAGLANTSVAEPERTFEALAADHATRGGINEQVLQHMTSHGVFDTFSEVLDAVMRRVSASSR